MKSVRTSIMALSFLAIFAVSGLVVNAQTTLVAGDIAFSGYISSFDPAVEADEFSFVLLKNITSTTVINFTDKGWFLGNVFNPGGETTITWTANSALSAGQEIRIKGLTATLASGPGTPGVVTGTSISLATTGDQVLAYQGAAATPTFISAIHMNVFALVNFDCGDTIASTWDPDCIGSGNNFSKIPTGLTTATNAIWIGITGIGTSEVDNARYTCGTGNIGTVASARAALNNPANWTQRSDFPNPVGFTLPTGCPYLVPTAASVSLSGRVLTADGRGIRNAIVVLTNSQGTSQSARTSSFGYYRFDGVQAGETYVMSVASKLYVFTPRVVTVSEELTGVDFVAESPQFEKSLK